MRNRNENQLNTNEKLTIGKHIIRGLLILSILIPLISEIYFIEHNLKLFYSGKDWIKVLINENHEIVSKINNSSKTKNINIYNKFGINSGVNSLVLLIKNPYEYISNTKLNIEEKQLKNLRGSNKNNLKKDSLYTELISLNKNLYVNNSNNDINNNQIIIRKSECDCEQLKDNYIDPDINKNEWYILKLDENYIITPIYLQIISVIILLLRWSLVFIYVIIQLLMPIKTIQESIDQELIKSSSLSIFYVASTSLCLSIIGMEGKDCINWWFLGPNPEYLLKSQIFVWLITCICIVLYLIRLILESTIELSRKYKLINDFITTFIYIPIGIIVLLSISLCILGIIKPWIFLIWITSLFIELEKNIRVLTKLYIERNINNNRNNNLRSNVYRVNQNNVENIQHINIELTEDNSKELNNEINNSLYKNMVIIPISNSYFKIFEFNLENCITRLYLWYINQYKIKHNNIVTNSELNEYNDNKLEIVEFSLENLENNLKIENILEVVKKDNRFEKNNSMGLSTTHILSNSNSYSEVNSLESINSDDFQKNQFVCNICYLEFDSTIIFTPCGHGNVCIECLGDYISNSFKSKQHPKCHICREEIFKIIEIYKNLEDKGLNLLKIDNIDEFNVNFISDIKLIAEIKSNKINYNQQNNNISFRDSFSNEITLKIYKKNSNIWSHPGIKEFIVDQDKKINNRVNSIIRRLLTVFRI